MRDPDERMVHCLEAINLELHEMNKQLRIANQISILTGVPVGVPNAFSTEALKKHAKEIAEALDLA